MELKSYLIYLSVIFPYIAAPGPMVFLSINYGMNYGVKKSVFLTLGNCTGLCFYASTSALGLGMLVKRYPVMGDLFKIIGACVLSYLALKMIKGAKALKNVHVNDRKPKPKTNLRMYKEGLILNLSNPNAMIFFSSIFPTFVDFGAGGVNFQFLILGVTFVISSFLVMNTFTIFSKVIFGKLLKGDRMIYFNIGSGLVMLAIACAIASSSVAHYM